MNERRDAAERHVHIPIFGLGCGGGGAREVERQLARTRGVRSVYVNPATETAYVGYDPSLVDLRQLAAVIDDAGYRPGIPVVQ
ncbi:MAG: cation transporter [Chloroflexota bacterium]